MPGVLLQPDDSVTDDTGRDIELSDLTETRVVPYAGLSFGLTEELTLYTNYSEIFQPQTEQRADGSQLDPIVGRQLEVGAKASLFDGGVNAQVAAFWLRNENRAEVDTVNTGAFLDSGETETRGVEVLFAGSPYPGVDITAGYSFVETELKTDPTPEHSFTVWGKYTVTSGLLQGLYVGTGVRAVSSFESLDGDIQINADAYAVIDAAIGYAITESFEAQIYVENLFDETYIDRINQTERGTFYGEPLNVYALQRLAKWLHPTTFRDLAPEATLDGLLARLRPVDLSGTYAIGLGPDAEAKE